MKITTGKFAGRERAFGIEYGDPTPLLAECVRSGIRWELSYGDSTPEEILLWTSADMIARIVRALEESRSVFFLGKEYRAGDDSCETAQEIEDTIVGSGLMVNIVSDDKDGLRISVSEG
jgi:hypothetical protein